MSKNKKPAYPCLYRVWNSQRKEWQFSTVISCSPAGLWRQLEKIIGWDSAKYRFHCIQWRKYVDGKWQPSVYYSTFPGYEIHGKRANQKYCLAKKMALENFGGAHDEQDGAER